MLILHLQLTEETEKFCAVGQVAGDSKCIQFFDVKVDFKTAKVICAAWSGQLVTIHSSNDNKKVANVARRYTNGRFWIGAKVKTEEDVTDESNWSWTDDWASDLNYQNFEADEPVSHGEQTCMQMHSKTELWMTGHCERLRLPSACEFPTQEAPRSSHCPYGYTWFNKTDFCYKNYVRFSDFQYARSTCQEDGGELVSIHSQTENDFIMDLSKVGQGIIKGEVWIGLVMQNGKWQWTDGTNVTYTRWNAGEPKFLDTGFRTTLHPTEKGAWNNNVLGNQRAFVCKMAALH